MQPPADLFTPAVDKARAFVVIAQQVIPKREPVVRVAAFVPEQRGHEFRAFVRGGVGEKGVELFRRREQADDIEMHTPRKRAVVDGVGKRHALLREVAREHIVNRMHARPLRQRDRARVQVLRLRLGESDARRPRRALVDPRTQHPDLLRRPFRPLLRHRRVRIQPAHGLHDQTLRALPNDRRRARVAAFQKRLARLDAQPALVLPLRVALDAGRLEKRLDVLGKIHHPRRRRRQLRHLLRRKRPRETRGAEQQGKCDGNEFHGTMNNRPDSFR